MYYVKEWILSRRSRVYKYTVFTPKNILFLCCISAKEKGRRGMSVPLDYEAFSNFPGLARIIRLPLRCLNQLSPSPNVQCRCGNLLVLPNRAVRASTYRLADSTGPSWPPNPFIDPPPGPPSVTWPDVGFVTREPVSRLARTGQA